MQKPPKTALSKGAVELPKRRKARGDNQDRCADQVGVSQATVSRWEDGTWKPAAVQRAILEAIYDIPSHWWEPDEKRERIEKRLAVLEALREPKPPPRRSRKR